MLCHHKLCWGGESKVNGRPGACQTCRKRKGKILVSLKEKKKKSKELKEQKGKYYRENNDNSVINSQLEENYYYLVLLLLYSRTVHLLPYKSVVVTSFAFTKLKGRKVG